MKEFISYENIYNKKFMQSINFTPIKKSYKHT